MKMSIDMLTDKHELFGIHGEETESWQRLEVPCAEETLEVRVPEFYAGGVERVVRADRAGDLLYVIGEVGWDYGDRGRIGCLLVARQVDGGTWLAVVCHSLFPLATTGLLPA